MTAWETIRETPRRLGAAASQARPQLRSIISPPRRLSPVTFAVLVGSLLVAGMVGMLVLTTVLQNQAFEVRAAQRAASELGYRASDLEAQANRAKAPEALGRRAVELGMVPNPHAVFIDVESGEVLGQPISARGDEMPSLTIAPAPSPAPGADAEEAEGVATEGAPEEAHATEGAVAEEVAEPATEEAVATEPAEPTEPPADAPQPVPAAGVSG
ncbi:MAG TPA: hypothetical protein GXZ45_09095 [Propionibacterium sp.]|nr:hypothetical protein [Propionibacterium sp.]